MKSKNVKGTRKAIKSSLTRGEETRSLTLGQEAVLGQRVGDKTNRIEGEELRMKVQKKKKETGGFSQAARGTQGGGGALKLQREASVVRRGKPLWGTNNNQKKVTGTQPTRRRLKLGK